MSQFKFSRFITIQFFEFCCYLSFWVLLLFELWQFDFCVLLQYEFWVLSQFMFLRNVTIWVEFGCYLSLEFCHNLSFLKFVTSWVFELSQFELDIFLVNNLYMKKEIFFCQTSFMDFFFVIFFLYEKSLMLTIFFVWQKKKNCEKKNRFSCEKCFLVKKLMWKKFLWTSFCW